MKRMTKNYFDYNSSEIQSPKGAPPASTHLNTPPPKKKNIAALNKGDYRR